MNSKFLEAGFKRSQIDPCVYYCQLDRNRGIMTVFVDDDTLIAETEEGMAELKRMIGSKFKFHDLGPLHHLLGIRFKQKPDGSLELDQSTYLTKVLERFNMESCRPIATPLEAGTKLDKSMSPTTDEDMGRMRELPYRELIGSLMYLSQGTRPDISYAVAKLGQFVIILVSRIGTRVSVYLGI